MKERLVKYLGCPSCGADLACAPTRIDPAISAWQELMEGTLSCVRCTGVYPIIDGVPRLVKDSWSESREERETVKGFGWQWKKFDKPIEDTYMTSSEHFLDFLEPVTPDFFEGKVVLDAGCGLGRFLKIGAEFGSREIIGMDLSEAVDAAYRRTRELPNAHVVQGDIMAPPFRIRFDYIFSIGVLHHLASPRDGFYRLTDLLDSGAHISAWVYAAENNTWITRVVTPIRKYVTSRLPRPVLLALSHALGIPLFALLKLVYGPANRKGAGGRIARLLPYNDYLAYTSRLSYSSVVSVVFDHLVPQLTSYISRDEFEGWFRFKNLTDVVITPRNNMSWRGFASRQQVTGAGPATS